MSGIEVPESWKARDAEVRAADAAREAAKQRRADAELRAAKEATGIPTRFLEAAGGELDDTEALAEVRRGGFEILVLAGDVGRGKTVAASRWLLDGICHAGRPPLFVSAARLSRWERYDVAEMSKLLLATRLVIDDLGEEFNDTKGNFLAVLDETICDRLANRRPTVITTNLAPEAFFERYGVRIRDRIREAGRWQSFAGPSMRKAKAA